MDQHIEDGVKQAVDPIQQKSLQRSIYNRKQSELLIWMFFAFLPLIPAFSDWLRHGGNLGDFAYAIMLNLNYVFLSLMVFIFPLLFTLIFGELPLATLRRRFDTDIRVEKFSVGAAVPVSSSSLANETPTVTAQTSVIDINSTNPRELLYFYTERTSEITKRIYGRAGVYLLVGVLISFTGLGFFYLRSVQTFPQSEPRINLTISGDKNGVAVPNAPLMDQLFERLVYLAPGFGILFFIEFIAFFFLRQYRSAMDEFRYFDAIRRNREENLVILKMFEENVSVAPTKDVLDAMRMYSSAGLIGKDETTDILESRKMQKDDLVIFEKILDVVDSVKNVKGKKDKDSKS